MERPKLKLDIEPADKYEKAKKDLITAMNSCAELSPQQKEQLALELLGVESFSAMCEMIKKNYR